jgi:hypothetical protein
VYGSRSGKLNAKIKREFALSLLKIFCMSGRICHEIEIYLKVSRDSVSTETTDVKFRTKDCSAYLFYTCKVARQKYMMLQTGGLSM